MTQHKEQTVKKILLTALLCLTISTYPAYADDTNNNTDSNNNTTTSTETTSTSDNNSTNTGGSTTTNTTDTNQSPSTEATATTSTPSQPQQPVRATLEIERIQQLEFGNFTTPPLTTGTITIDAATGTRTVGGEAKPIGSSYQRAIFRIKGEPNEDVEIFLPQDLDLSPDKAAEEGSARITKFESSPSLTTKLDANGQQDIYVGGTLEIKSSNASIEYNGSFNISTQYTY